MQNKIDKMHNPKKKQLRCIIAQAIGLIVFYRVFLKIRETTNRSQINFIFQARNYFLPGKISRDAKR